MTDISPEAVERLASIEDNGGCADLQFTWYAHTLRALSARVAELEAEVANTRAALPAPEVTVAEAVPEVVTYTNWRGETSTRSIIPKHVWYGSTEWHPHKQWFLRAFDTDKQADRDFALSDLGDNQ